MANQRGITAEEQAAPASPGVTMQELASHAVAVGSKTAARDDAVRRGLTLLHTCRSLFAVSGDLLTFDTYILNEGTGTLGDIRLVPLSFHNADMAQLSYVRFGEGSEHFNGVLLPGSFVKFTAQYHLTRADVVAGGPLISAMYATAVADGGVLVRAESDVVLEVGRELDANSA